MPRSHIRVRHGHDGIRHTVKHDGKWGPGRVPARKFSAPDPDARNPYVVRDLPRKAVVDHHGRVPFGARAIDETGTTLRVVQSLPVRMKFPRRRRCSQ